MPEGYLFIGGECVLPAECEVGLLKVLLDTYGFLTTPQLPNGDLFLLGSQINFRVSSTTLANATTFPVNLNRFGPRIVPLLPNLEGFRISRPNSSLTAVSCQDNFRNISFVIAGQGVTEGDTIRLSLQNIDGSGTELLATFVVRGNGVSLTRLNPQASLFFNNRVAVGAGRLSVGAFIPFNIAIEGDLQRTELLTLELRGVPVSQLERCAQLALDITRSSGGGTTAFVFTDITVNRINRFGDTSTDGRGLLQGLTGGFPTDIPCPAVCAPCPFVVPPVRTGGDCRSMCFRSADYYFLHPDQLPTGTVLIGGVNFNVPVNIQTRRQDVLFALQGGFGMLSPLQQLNRQFVATQLTVQRQGFLSIPGTLRLQLGCFDVTGLPVTLSNGQRLTRESTLGDLFEQARASIINQRSADMLILANLFAELNNSDAFGLCR